MVEFGQLGLNGQHVKEYVTRVELPRELVLVFQKLTAVYAMAMPLKQEPAQ